MSHITNDLTLTGLSIPNISSSSALQAIIKDYKKFLWDTTETYKHIIDWDTLICPGLPKETISLLATMDFLRISYKDDQFGESDLIESPIGSKTIVQDKTLTHHNKWLGSSISLFSLQWWLPGSYWSYELNICLDTTLALDLKKKRATITRVAMLWLHEALLQWRCGM